MKLVKVTLLVISVMALFAWMALAEEYTIPNFVIGWGYAITENFGGPSFEGSASSGGANDGLLTAPATIGTCYLTRNGDWTIQANDDFTVTLEVTIPQGVNTGYYLGGTWNPGFDAYNVDGTSDMEHIPAADQQFYGTFPGEPNYPPTSSPLTATWQAITAQSSKYATRDTFISTLILNMGINRQGLYDPADTYVTTVTITVSQ